MLLSLSSGTAWALTVTPIDLPDQPLLAWSQRTDTGAEIRAVPYRDRGLRGDPIVIARHDGPLQPGPRLTEDIVLLRSGSQRWWVELESGSVTALPDGAVLRHSMLDRVILQEPSGQVWSSPLSPIPQLTDLGQHGAVLGDLRGEVLLADGSTLTEHPSGKTHELGVAVPAGSTGWVPVGADTLHIIFPSGGGAAVSAHRPAVVFSSVPAPRPAPAPPGDLTLRRGRLAYTRYGESWELSEGDASDARWWVPTVPRWGAGFFEAGSLGRPPAGLCVEQTGPAPMMHCASAGGRGYTFSRRSHEAGGHSVQCPDGQWLSGTSHVTMQDVAAAWWCVDHQLQRTGAGLFEEPDGTYRTEVYP